MDSNRTKVNKQAQKYEHANSGINYETQHLSLSSKGDNSVKNLLDTNQPNKKRAYFDAFSESLRATEPDTVNVYDLVLSAFLLLNSLSETDPFKVQPENES